MYKLLAASALSLALLSGTAIAQVDVDAGADTGASGSVDDNDVNADGTLKLGADAATDLDTDELDTESTAAIGADAEINAVLDSFGDDANAFFTDESRTEVKSEAEIQAAFNALTAEQQDALLTACGDVSGSADASTDDASASASVAAAICAAI